MKIQPDISETQLHSVCRECNYIRAATISSLNEVVTDIKDFDNLPETERLLYCWLVTFLPGTDQAEAKKYLNHKGAPPDECPKEILFNIAGYIVRNF